MLKLEVNKFQLEVYKISLEVRMILNWQNVSEKKTSKTTIAIE